MPSVYIHVPFCRSKCAYCDFYSETGWDEGVLERYIEVLQQQMRQLSPWLAPHAPLDTVFFGGGTPSLLSGGQVARLLQALRQLWGLAPDCEISLEANPDSITWSKLRQWRQAGVNRLSIGAQVAADRALAWLGRPHSYEQTRQAFAMARACGFDNIGLDILFGLPADVGPPWPQALKPWLQLRPEHISLYGLTVEAGTPLAQQQPLLPTEECQRQQYLQAHSYLTSAGYSHYEIANYALPGFRCRHNSVYWQRHSYLGLGPGAHSFVAGPGGQRWAAPASLATWLASVKAGGCAIAKQETLTPAQGLAETLYLGMRTAWGVPEALLEQCYGSCWKALQQRLWPRWQPFLQQSAGHWRFGLEGWLLYDYLVSEVF